MILKTFGDMGWKGAQDGVRGEFLRWFPPNSLKALWEVSLRHVWIQLETTEKGLKMLSQNVLILGQKGIPK